MLDRLGSHEQASEEAAPTLDDARATCRRLASKVYPGLPLLESLVSTHQHDDLATLIAFCAWSYDLEESGAQHTGASAPKRLERWRKELQRCQSAGRAPAGSSALPTHPVFVALGSLVERGLATMVDLHQLMDCFEIDYRAPRIDTWAELRERTIMMARPLCRIALKRDGVHRERAAERDARAMAELLLSAHLLTLRWQGLRSDVEIRRRSPLPVQDTGFDAADLRSMLDRRGEPQARVPFIRAMRPLIRRTRAMNAEARPLLRTARADLKPGFRYIWQTTEAILDAIEQMGCACLWESPQLPERRTRRIAASARPSRIFSARRDS